MVIKQFPPLSEADENGLIAIGGDVEVESLVNAYQSGIFPWPLKENLLAWFSPPVRAVLYCKDLHLSRSMKKVLRSNPYQIRWNFNFSGVVTHCANSSNRKGPRGTWITSDLIPAYNALHKAGYAYSVESYQEQVLVGGLYGVRIGSYYSGESMFYLRENASKIALIALIEHLRHHGIEWIDCQVMTPLFKSLGATEISREHYIEMLRDSIAKPNSAIGED